MRLGKVQQKECTGNAVVKPGKLYRVQCHVYQCLSASRATLKGRQLKLAGNSKSKINDKGHNCVVQNPAYRSAFFLVFEKTKAITSVALDF